MAKGRRSGRLLIFVSIVLILLLLLVFLATRFMGGGLLGGVTNPAPNAVAVPTQVVQDTVNIVMTTQNISRGKTISESQVTTVAMPRKDFIEGSFFTEAKQVIGSRAKFDLKAHTPLNDALVVLPEGKGSITAFEIPKGMVAISVPVSKLSTISYGLQKGDHVNVIASLLMVDMDINFQTKLPNKTGVMVSPGPIGETQSNLTASASADDPSQNPPKTGFAVVGRIELDPSINNPLFVVPAESQRPRLVSQSLIQDAAVLQVGDFNTPSQAMDQTAQATPIAGANAPAAPAEALLPGVVTLVVSPQDAINLNYLMLSGANLNMVLRSAGDDEKVKMEAATLQFIMDQYNIPNPAKLPYGMEPRMDSFPTMLLPFPESLNPNKPTPTPAPQ